MINGPGNLTKVISAVGHLRDHPQHDDVVQPVGCPQQILHSLQLEVGSLVDALPTEQVVPGCPLVEETVPTSGQLSGQTLTQISDHNKPVLEQPALTVSRGQQ